MEKKKQGKKTLRSSQWRTPTVSTPERKKDQTSSLQGFPLHHHSYSAWYKLLTNPFMFKVNQINGDYIDTTTSATQVLGKAMHKAMEVYLGGGGQAVVDEADAIKSAHKAGLDYLAEYPEGFVEYGSAIESRAKLEERYAFSFFGYIKDFNYRDYVAEPIMVEKMIERKVLVEGRELPVPLKGRVDFCYRDKQGRVVIRDHKFSSKYSDDDEIDAGKLIQAAFNSFLVYAELGEAPHSMVFAQFKTTQNKDSSRQTREYEIVFADNPLIFDFFYRLYDDITSALMGRQVYLPNISAFFDKEVSVLAYIHRLDVDEVKASEFKRMKVDNITDFLKKKIQRGGAEKVFLQTVSQKFVSARTLNYKDMKIEEKIKMKLAEHGLGLEFEDKIVGSAVTLYRYEPSVGLKMSKIEAYVADIEQVAEVSGIRVLAPIPNTGFVGFEVPNRGERKFPKAPATRGGFEVAIGEDILGRSRYFDVREAPHMLVAGASGSGKSVFLNSMVKQLIGQPRTELHLFDPKQVEFSEYEGKVEQYEHKPAEITKALKELVEEMDSRYERMQKAKAKGIENMRLPYKFVFIDEYADLVMRGETGSNIQLLAQKGRACGIHLVISTQRASTRIISGDIKVNFPTKAVFRMAKAVDSRIMLDEEGAEKLLGKGDMLFSTEEGVERLQGYKL